jgi:hypothetical protein
VGGKWWEPVWWWDEERGCRSGEATDRSLRSSAVGTARSVSGRVVSEKEVSGDLKNLADGGN